MRELGSSCVKIAMSRTGRLLSLCAAVLIGASGAVSQSAPQPTRSAADAVSIPLFEKAPTIDGQLNEDEWKTAAVFKDFYQVQPGDNVQASKATRVLAGYDANNLYVAFHAYDESGKVRATVAKRDSVLQDDYVGIFLDTYNDTRRAYVLYFNPLGVQQDGIFTEGAVEDYSFDVVMQSKGSLTGDGYVVEVAIPFKSLRYKAGRGRAWGIHLFRSIKRLNDEIDSWMPISRDKSDFFNANTSLSISQAKSGLLNQQGHIIGLEGIASAHSVEVIPTLTLSESGSRVQGAPSAADTTTLLNKPIKTEPGLTARFGITPTVTLDLALNPDFAEVEADLPVVLANQRFPIFFEEKRPFFLEGADIFDTPLNAVHTRAIIDPTVAVKLTGKAGRTAFGFLAASDAAPGNFSDEERADPRLLPSIQRFIDKKAYVGVARVKRDIGKESKVGAILASYNFIERHSQVGGFDGRFRLNPQTIFDFQVLGTTARRYFFDPDLGKNIYRTGNGFAYYLNLDRISRHNRLRVVGLGRTRDYRADVGFTRRTGVNIYRIFGRYNSEPKPKARFISWSLQNQTNVIFDWKGGMRNWDTYPHAIFNFRRQTSVTVYFLGGYERLLEEEFGPRRTTAHPGAFIGNDSERQTYYKSFEFEAKTTPSKKYSLYLHGYHTLDKFDFDLGNGRRFPRVSPAALLDPGAPLDPGAGDESFLNATVTYQPTDALRTSFNVTKTKLRRNDTGRVAFDSNIFTLRGTYQFTRFSFVRARVDYDTLLTNVRGQFLFGWSPNPGTSLYVGYNDDLNYDGFNKLTGQFEPGFRRNGRTFFVKMSYLIRRNF
jgi:Domain of unknown function (DUF5916)/Carbohydrate family 9 binding domain-like